MMFPLSEISQSGFRRSQRRFFFYPSSSREMPRHYRSTPTSPTWQMPWSGRISGMRALPCRAVSSKPMRVSRSTSIPSITRKFPHRCFRFRLDGMSFRFILIRFLPHRVFLDSLAVDQQPIPQPAVFGQLRVARGR